MRQKYRNKPGFLRAVFTSALALFGGLCPAQYQPVATVPVDSVTKPGIYRIVLPPSFVARCRTDLSDIRIFTGVGKEAPYVLRTADSDRFNAGYLPLPDPKISRKDSTNHFSYYLLQYDDFYRIDRLSLVITSPALYKRSAYVLPAGGRATGTTGSFSLDPSDTVIPVEHFRTDSVLIEVSNEDNAPLEITRVAGAQSGIYLLAYLEPGNSYRLVAGDSDVVAPKYDLHYFTDSALLPPVTIGVGSVERVGTVAQRKPGRTRSAGKPGQLILWSIIGATLVLLLFVSVKLTRAIDKKEKE